VRSIKLEDGITYVLLEDWARKHQVPTYLVRIWFRASLLKGVRKPPNKPEPLIIPKETKKPTKAGLLNYAEGLFRKVFIRAILDYERAPDGDQSPRRARWSKEEIMTLCQWPYPDDWSMLRSRLEARVGLIMLRPGSGNPWKDEVVKVWTFATCPEDREWGILNAIGSQLGGMKRTAKVTSLAIAPPDERNALNEGSKERIDKLLQKQDTKLDRVLSTLQNVKQDLLDRDTMKLLEGLGD